MATVPLDPFKLTEMQEAERKQFNGTMNRLKKKIHSVENIMYSQPFADSHEDFKLVWNQKLSKILADDCGISALTATRNPKPVYGRQDTIEVVPRAKTPVAEDNDALKQKQKKKVKTVLNDLATRKPFGGSKRENETLRVINNYNGSNTFYKGKRILKRLGPQGQGPLPTTGVPPWIGPCYYTNITADKLLYGKPTDGFQAPFKSVGREPKQMSEIRQKLAVKKEWSGLFSGPNSVYGSASIPFSAKTSLTDHSECVSEREDSNVWSKMSAATTLGAKQVTDHYITATTPYFGHKTIRTSSPRRRRKGLIDDEESSQKINIHKERIFDAAVLDQLHANSNEYADRGDDLSLSTSVFGGSDDADSLGSASSLSTQKRFDTISLLSKSVNFAVFTGFPVDKVMKNLVAKKKRTHDIADFTMGALASYNESIAESLSFTDPHIGNIVELASNTHTPHMSPRPENSKENSSGVSPRGLSRSLTSAPTLSDSADSGDEISVSSERAGILVKLMRNSPNKTNVSIGFCKPRKITKKDIAAAPGRSTCRRSAITPAPLCSPECSLDGPSIDSSLSAPLDLSNSYGNLNTEITRSRSNLLSRTSSRLGIDSQPPLSKQPSTLTSQRSMRRQRSNELPKTLSQSMSKLTVEDQKALIETGVSVYLGGLLLPGDGIDDDGSAALYSPPETPRIATPRKSSAGKEKLKEEELFELEGDNFDEGEDFMFDEDEVCLRNKKKKKMRKT